MQWFKKYAPSLSTHHKRLIRRATYYYDKGLTYGRDGQFELLKKKQPKLHPGSSKEEIEL